MTVSWNGGYNVASYVVQRRKAGETEWTDVTTLPPSARSFCNDDPSVKKGFYEFRVLAVPTAGEPAPTSVVSCAFNPKRGLVLLFR